MPSAVLRRPVVGENTLVRRRAATPLMSGGKKLKIGIVGATGAVGEEIVKVSGLSNVSCSALPALSKQ